MGESDIDWDSEIDNYCSSHGRTSCSSLTIVPCRLSLGGYDRSGEASASSGSLNVKLIKEFVEMGFSESHVVRAIDELGCENHTLIVETLLTYKALEEIPQSNLTCAPGEGYPDLSYQEQRLAVSDHSSSNCDADSSDDFSDTDSPPIQGASDPSSDEDERLKFLKIMGYSADEADIAIERCGPDASVLELTDFLSAAEKAREYDILYMEEDEKKPNNSSSSKLKKRNSLECYSWKRKKQHTMAVEGDDMIRLPNPMTGFGVPSGSYAVVQTRKPIPPEAKGPPYFYYENVALAPKGAWDTISRFLFEIEPEFVDSKYFCACARKRGYIHNLPIEGRYPLLPLPPHTISEAFPLTEKWWPAWDTRTKLNCLQTCIGSAKMTDRIRKALEECGDTEPPKSVQKYVMDLCRKWNLLWVGKNKLAPLEPDEFETLLGFPKNHTRGGGISRTDRYKSLGNSFQVDTVAYHLSVLKKMYPDGINVLSLFSGIGGAEIALHRLGIPLKVVVEVEISEANRNIMRSWWEQTNQRGTLIDLPDVTKLDHHKLVHLIDAYGGFDLVVGGSPCNNLAGSNRHHRDGLDGKESSLFYQYFRILESVQQIMKDRSLVSEIYR